MEFVEGSAGKRRQKALQNYSHNLWLLREYKELYQDTLLDKERMLQHVRYLIRYTLIDLSLHVN